MKYLFLLSFIAFSISAKASDADTLKGVWKVSKKGDFYFYNFVNDSILRITHKSDTINYKYKIDTAATWPKKIDIVLIDRLTGLGILTNRGLFEFMGPTKVRIRFGEDDKERPLNFMPKGNLETVIMVKQ